MILCTFPGRYGDLLWALPTLRAIAEIYGPVDLKICGEFQGIMSLLDAPYLGKIHADPEWGMSHGWRPPIQEGWISPYEKVLHLGYQRWPELVLPEETYVSAVSQIGHALPRLDLQTPWLTVASSDAYQRKVAFGWSDCHFELKFGLSELLFPDNPDEGPADAIGVFPPGSRWVTEGGYSPCGWVEAAQWIRRANVFLTDCSALHVLAVALGTMVVIVEPMEERWNPIFYPLGMNGPAVTMVKGLDGRPTFDARHTREVLFG